MSKEHVNYVRFFVLDTLVYVSWLEPSRRPTSSVSSLLSYLYIQVSFLVQLYQNNIKYHHFYFLYVYITFCYKNIYLNASKMWCYTRLTYMPMSYLYWKRFVSPITLLTLQLRDELYAQSYNEITTFIFCIVYIDKCFESNSA